MEYLLFSFGPLILPRCFLSHFWEITLTVAPPFLLYLFLSCLALFCFVLIFNTSTVLWTLLSYRCNSFSPFKGRTTLSLFAQFLFSSCLFWYLLSQLKVLLVIFACPFILGRWNQRLVEAHDVGMGLPPGAFLRMIRACCSLGSFSKIQYPGIFSGFWLVDVCLTVSILAAYLGRRTAVGAKPHNFT